MFSGFSAEDCDVLALDVEELVTAVMVATHKPRRWVEKAVFGYHRLRMLPGLKAAHDAGRFVDVDRLAAIDRALDLLPADAPAEVWARVDAMLVSLLRVRPGKALPSVWSITNRLHALLASFDPAIGYDPAKRTRREHARRAASARVGFYPVEENGVRRVEMTLAADAATMAVVRARARALARERKTSMAGAVVDMLVGEVPQSVRPVLNLYTPKPADTESVADTGAVGGGVFIAGFGWAGAAEAEMLEKLSAAAARVDLDEVAGESTGSYVPTGRMVSLVRARDGVCIYPGCHRPAERCQVDHRIPFGQGGATTPANLFLLCQHHHNRKTDRHAFYIPDPVTGEVVWLFSNGTWVVEDNKGIIHTNTTPSNPRWEVTVGQYRRTRQEAARFQAACHRLVDIFEADGDYDACINGIHALENHYKMTFDFTPQPEEAHASLSGSA